MITFSKFADSTEYQILKSFLRSLKNANNDRYLDDDYLETILKTSDLITIELFDTRQITISALRSHNNQENICITIDGKFCIFESPAIEIFLEEYFLPEDRRQILKVTNNSQLWRGNETEGQGEEEKDEGNNANQLSNEEWKLEDWELNDEQLLRKYRNLYSVVKKTDIKTLRELANLQKEKSEISYKLTKVSNQKEINELESRKKQITDRILSIKQTFSKRRIRLANKVRKSEPLDRTLSDEQLKDEYNPASTIDIAELRKFHELVIRFKQNEIEREKIIKQQEFKKHTIAALKKKMNENSGVIDDKIAKLNKDLQELSSELIPKNALKKEYYDLIMHKRSEFSMKNPLRVNRKAGLPLQKLTTREFSTNNITDGYKNLEYATASEKEALSKLLKEREEINHKIIDDDNIEDDNIDDELLKAQRIIREEITQLSRNLGQRAFKARKKEAESQPQDEHPSKLPRSATAASASSSPFHKDGTDKTQNNGGKT